MTLPGTLTLVNCQNVDLLAEGKSLKECPNLIILHKGHIKINVTPEPFQDKE
jgi:hypothetical protein